MPPISRYRWTVKVARYCPTAAARGLAKCRIPVGVFLLIGLFGCEDPVYPTLSSADVCDDLEAGIVNAEGLYGRRFAERSFDENCLKGDAADSEEERKKRPKKDDKGSGGELDE